ncbi:hypothetical protein KZZ52_15085 [Dactylosporangium sp. AC04546]|uniref:hypothetical protein n=1 Tax=Dactylosporangium sp. AC04546 TaxID=2862460 RepID=UPI001EE1376F|nr:hypothetical protein [Dactylosporangium sp. AC04546]WVK86636.1 hypothetical protein KZZ52_15085 [Dactylosporangium sp. AC04546]
MNLATSAGHDLSDHLQYFAEHLPTTSPPGGPLGSAVAPFRERIERRAGQLVAAGARVRALVRNRIMG